MRAVAIVLAIWCAGLGAAAQFAKISVSYDLVGQAYAAWPGAWIGLMVSIVGLLGVIFGTTAGLLVARVGARRALIASLLLGAAASLIESFLPAYPLMMACRLLEGVSQLGIVVVGPVTIASTVSGPRQGAAMTLWSSFFGVTYAVMAWIGPPILQAGGLALLFRLHGAWMLAFGAILAGLLPRDVPLAAVGPRGGILAEHVRLYTSPTIGAPPLGFVFYTITYVAVLTLLPGAMSPGWGQAAGVAMPLASIGVSLTLGVWLLSRISAVQLGQGGFALAILGALALWGFAGQGEAGFLASLVLGAGLGLAQGASFAAIPQLIAGGEDRALSAGAMAQMGNLGTVSGTPMLVVIMQGAALSGLALFVIFFSGLGIAMHALQARRRQTTEPPP